MSEEDIIKECERIIFEYGCIRQDTEGEKEDLQALTCLLDLYNKEKNDINKLIRYIAIREDKDFEQVMKEFEIGG